LKNGEVNLTLMFISFGAIARREDALRTGRHLSGTNPWISSLTTLCGLKDLRDLLI
jgi:hypothetical protein